MNERWMRNVNSDKVHLMKQRSHNTMRSRCGFRDNVYWLDEVRTPPNLFLGRDWPTVCKKCEASYFRYKGGHSCS